ncbi:MAG: AAA family ATPase [Trueperaceae bacterium]
MSAGSAGDAARVVWERVRLEGFGRHADVRVDLPAALGVWIAPNEAGKTTAVLGLVAVLWGLPHVQDATAFTWARFRSWGGGAHRGAVTLRAGDARFTVQRAFDTHRVRVVAHEAGGDRVVVDAVHNPNARRETTPYLPWVRATLGLTEADVVLATFVVAQGDLGGPRHALGADVQLLLAGAGGGGWVGARERLEEELRARTRRLRSQDAGFTRDGTVDRAVELAEARAAALEAALEAGRGAADAFERAQLEVRAADGAHREALVQRERWAAGVAAQRAWVERREAYARSLARRAELARSAAAAHDRVAEARAAHAEAEALGDGAAFAGADATAGQRFEAWAEAARAAGNADECLVQAREARDAAMDEAHREVAAALADERSVPAPPRDWSAWAADVRDAGGERLAASVAAAREACGRWAAALAAARAACAQLAAVDAARAPLAAFDRFDPALGPEVRGYAAQRDAWDQRLAEADAALAAARDRVEGHAARFGPVRALAPEVAAALRAFATAHERPDGSAAWRWLGAIGWAAAIGMGAGPLAAAFEVDLSPVAAWGAGAVAALVWALALPRRPALRRARRAVAVFAARGALEEAATALGRPVADDDARLELARRLEAYDALGADVARDEAELLALEERCASLREGADAFDRRWAPWRRSLIAAGAPTDVDLGAAHAEWTRLTGERAVALERVRAAAAALGVDVDGAPADLRAAVAQDAPAARAGRDGPQVVAWARFQGGVVGAAPRVGEVEAWLARVAASTWARWLEEAARAERLHERRRAAAEHRGQAEADAGRVVAEHERAVRREEDRAAASAGAARSAREAVAETLGPDGADAVARWGGDAEAALAAWRAHRSARATAAAAAGAARAHLAALGVQVALAGDGVATPEALGAGVAQADRRAEAATVEAGARLAAWRDLVAAHPDLPSADAADAAAGAGEAPPSAGGPRATAAFGDARMALAAAEGAVTAAEGRALAAREALARLQGSDPIDVAVAELELLESRRTIVRVRGERDALALALRTLDAAVEDFRGAHAERLQVAASGYFAAFSGVEGRRVVLDEAFAAHVVEPGGDVALPAQLSQGARDQLSVALRLAVADLLAADVRLPLVFDDPFLNWDAARTERLAKALRALARDRQVVVLSHRAALAEWGEAVAVEGA